MQQTSPNNVIRITRRAADRLRAGHLWVYRTEIEGAVDAIEAGALVTVADGRGIALGSALYSSTSQIAARVVSRKPAMTRAEYVQDARAKIDAALARRTVLAPVSERDNAHRLIFSEAD